MWITAQLQGFMPYTSLHMSRYVAAAVSAAHERTTFVVAGIIMFGAVLVSASLVLADTSSTSVTVGNSAPTVSVTFNGGNNITLTENTFVHATATLTVTDANGCSTITGNSVQFAFASTSSGANVAGETCTYNANTCYKPTVCVATTTGNTCTGGADTSAQYDCGFQIWYPARPTDASSPGITAGIWYVAATTTDASAATGFATNTGQTIEVNTLNALNVSASIAFGTVSSNSDTGSSNQTVTHTNTGNTNIDNQISGDVMCTDYSTCAGGVLQPSQQKYSSANVTYASLAQTLAATSSPATFEMLLATSTATTSAVSTSTFWGIAIPNGQTTGAYTGQNTFTAVAD